MRGARSPRFPRPGCAPRWTVEESGQQGAWPASTSTKSAAGISWHRWTVPSMLAYAFLAVLAATEHANNPPPEGMIPLMR